ncbi:MAM33 family protein [Aspergillus novofumigatus IBT 16806]|uniref:Regulatory protein SUAPRGA1 n=1 Tax=Aspergillus novofumigatus (strain IBT 16806) TaxID=1392255 RepID=A0A2I1C2R4_ASPN1|nr:regulatory protein SUAPRGA1 [Aspergillus novofumigatus IBT 16806]PKX91936.1 regulatory protein SUAPRGA1 [Aspergillus novofumigatus IBT 16806]
MLSLRTFARSVPRTLSRSIATTSRSSFLSVPKNGFLQASLKQATRPSYAAFSTSSVFRQSPAEGDIELVAKLEDELKHEQASGLEDLETSVQNIQYVLQNNSWEVKDVPGEQEIVLTKKFGKEEIRLTFTVADLQNLSEQEDFDDSAFADEMDFQGHQPANQGRGAPVLFPARVNITIEKPGNGSLLIQTVAQDGLFQIEEVSYFSKPDLAHAQTAEQDWARQSLYAGPPFENLDEDLQTFLERYLEERGINAELANMIPDYIQVKEQKEYVRWLENVKKFVAA